MEREQLYEHIFSTYISIRKGMAWVAFLLAPIVAGWGFLYGIELQPSISDYYWAARSNPIVDFWWSIFLDPAAPSRVWFVGLIFALAAFLYLYKGFSDAENIALNLAAALAVGTAIFPTCNPSAATCGSFSIHGASAIGAFACLAYVVWFCATDTLEYLPSSANPNAEQYRTIYNLIFLGMVAAPVIAFVLNSIARTKSYVFWAEFAALAVFALYWSIKGTELSKSRATRRALAKEITARSSGHVPKVIARVIERAGKSADPAQ